MRHALTLATAFAISTAFAASAVSQEKVVEIPLKEIWALDMPGTRDIRELSPEWRDKSDLSLADRILGSQLFQSRDRPTRGFAVAGVELDALKNVESVLVDGDAPPESLPSHGDVSLVFFSAFCGRYVHIRSVEIGDRTIKIRYAFVPHMSKNLTAHLALIPIERLAPGKWHVSIRRVHENVSGWKPVSDDVAHQVVCEPFDFVLENERRPP